MSQPARACLLSNNICNLHDENGNNKIPPFANVPPVDSVHWNDAIPSKFFSNRICVRREDCRGIRGMLKKRRAPCSVSDNHPLNSVTQGSRVAYARLPFFLSTFHSTETKDAAPPIACSQLRLCVEPQSLVIRNLMHSATQGVPFILSRSTRPLGEGRTALHHTCSQIMILLSFRK